MAGLRSTKILAALSARLAAQGLAGHLIQFEAGFAPSSSPCIFAAAKHRFRFFDKLHSPSNGNPFRFSLPVHCLVTEACRAQQFRAPGNAVAHTAAVMGVGTYGDDFAAALTEQL